MTKQSKATDDLGELLAERDRIDAWLSALEGRRETTPPQVYERVHGDYAARRDALVAQLGERMGDLEASLAKLAAKLATAGEEQRAKQEARAEAELRAAVGEHTPEKWAELAATSDAELAKLEARRTEVARDHAHARELLASVKRSPSGAHPAVSDADGAVRAPAVPAPAAPAARAAPAAPAPRAAPVIAEPELVIMALGEMLVAPAASAPKRPSAATTVPAEPAPRASGAVERPGPDTAHRINTPGADELAFLRSIELDQARKSGAVQPIAAPPLTPPPRAAATSATREPTLARISTPDPRTTKPSLAPNDPSLLTDAAVNVPRASTDLRPVSGEDRQTSSRLTSRDSANLLKGVQSEHSKTIKCAACGAGNFPTEWYCERCGAELSSL